MVTCCVLFLLPVHPKQTGCLSFPSSQKSCSFLLFRPSWHWTHTLDSSAGRFYVAVSYAPTRCKSFQNRDGDLYFLFLIVFNTWLILKIALLSCWILLWSFFSVRSWVIVTVLSLWHRPKYLSHAYSVTITAKNFYLVFFLLRKN